MYVFDKKIFYEQFRQKNCLFSIKKFSMKRDSAANKNNKNSMRKPRHKQKTKNIKNRLAKEHTKR